MDKMYNHKIKLYFSCHTLHMYNYKMYEEMKCLLTWTLKAIERKGEQLANHIVTKHATLYMCITINP